jgi:hypothetical protein
LNLLSSDTFIESSDKITLGVTAIWFFSAKDMVALKCVMPNHYFCYFFLLYFSLSRVLHSIRSLILPLLCRGSMYSLSYGYLNFFDGEVWRKKVCDPESLLSLLFLLYFY